MKQIMLLICAAISAVTMLSCSASEEMELNDIPDSGNPQNMVSVEIEFNVPQLDTKSRTYGHSEFIAEEDRINWFRYYVYDSKGMLSGYGKCGSSAETRVSMHLNSNAEYTMYAIANGPEISPVPATENDILNSAYQNESLGGLNSEVEDCPRLMMTAIAALEANDDGYKVRLDFRRMTARIGLSFDTSALNNDVSLEIKEVSVVNIPSQVYYFKENAPVEGLKCLSSACSVVPSGLDDKVVFYCYENVQGELLPGNSSQMTKFFPESSRYNELCTYICVKGTYSSPRKRGEIIYRLYPGRDASDFSLERNSVYDVNIKFSAEGGVDEVSWRVVTDGLETLTTGVEVRMDDYELNENEKVPFMAVVSPEDASRKHLNWQISEPGIAGFCTADGKEKLSLSQINAIDDNRGPFLIYGLCNGSAVLSAESTDGTLKKGSAEFTVNLEPYPYRIEFDESFVPLWYLNDNEYEVRYVAFSKLDMPAGQVPDIRLLSGADCVEILSVDRNGVSVRAKGLGRAVIGSRMGMAIAECAFTVSELGISLDTDNMLLAAGFGADVKYLITPAHASSMGVTLAYCDGSSSSFTSESNRVECVAANASINVKANYLNCRDLSENQGRIRAYVNGHSACDECSYSICQPMKRLQEEQLCLMNYRNGTQYTASLIDCPADVPLSMSWFRDYSLSGTDGEATTPVSAPASSEILWDREMCRFSYPSPGTGINGHYKVHFSLDGDFSHVNYVKADGTPGTVQEFIAECASASVDLKFAEMVYIISYMKSDSRNSMSKDGYRYIDELIVRCVKHYRSNIDNSLFSDLSFDYSYDGKQFHYSGEGDSHTEYYIDYDITFVKDSEYPYIELSSADGIYYNTSFKYTGSNAPAKHFDGTRLSVPSMTNIANHKGFWYRYVQKNSGLSGFCKEIDWQILYSNLF